MLLPVPVAAQAHISLPIKAKGIVRACTEVGVANPKAVTAYKYTLYGHTHKLTTPTCRSGRERFISVKAMLLARGRGDLEKNDFFVSSS